MKRFGTEYGGFYYPENLNDLNESSIIYCIGAGEDISHDIEIAHKLNSNIYIIDPTPRAIKHCDYVKNILEGKDKIIYDSKFGGGNPYEYWKIILENKIDTNKIIYKNYGIGIADGLQKFYLPSNEEHVSCSLVEGMKGKKYIDVHVKKLRSIMNELNHNNIDLLKMDIEGSECDVIENMLEEQIYPKYLAVEFDLGFNGENIKDIDKCNKTIQKLIENNYELIYKNKSDFTFYYKNIKKYDDKKILFLLNNPGPPDRAQYQHTLISIGEGLEKLNISYDSNINYYKKTNGLYLFNKKLNIDYNNYDYIFTSPCSHYLEHIHYKENDNIFITEKFLSNKNRKYKLIMIDWSDGFFEFNKYLKYYDFYFKSSYQNNILPKINTNIYPCVFNVTNRIINATKHNNSWNIRNINLLYSHRVSHEVRGYMLELYKNDNFVTFYDDKFKEPNKNDSYYIDWCQTGRRHNPHFYETLKKSKMVDCTGGFVRNINNELVICQIDSFKLWEAFFAGCCVIMIDLDLFNIKFPVQPQNMVHYIGITLNKENDKKILENIKNEKIDIKKIAQNGYEFVKKNYSPLGLTKYILETINYI
jgi:FkbM family methyltransferase